MPEQSGTDETRIDEILGEWLARREAGEDVIPDAVVAAHPDVADELRARFAALDLVDQALGVTAQRPVPERLGDYTIERELGSGGMGTVYLARDGGGERVALKLVHAHLLERPGFFKRFLREAEIGRRVSHENVVQILGADACVIDGVHHHFLVMQYVEGQDLRDLVEELGRVPEELVRHVGREIARALVAVHAAGAVHRDLKPENVLITPEHGVKLMDLGVALDLQAALRLSQTGAFVGSVAYAAPEQLSGGDCELDARTDLHGLGLILYELASGRHPFGDAHIGAIIQRVLDETPRPLSNLRPDVSPFLGELIGTLLAKDPDHRPDSAQDVLETLEQGERSPWWAGRERRRARTPGRPLRRPSISRETMVHGRDSELDRLDVLYRAAKRGRGRVVLIDGEAGIGKTRLIDEAVARLASAGEDLNFLLAAYPPGGAATSAGALAAAFREHLGPEGSGRYLGTSPLLVPGFDAFLRSEPPPEGTEKLTRDSLQACVAYVTQALSAERPTIVVVEDLHFAPDEARALFASLAFAIVEHPVLLIGTARPGVPAEWLAELERAEHVERMELTRLGPNDIHRLLREAFQSERLADDLGWRIARRSDGNPFFVFEILRDLRDRRALTQRPDGSWETSGDVAEIRIPSSVLDLVRARVGELGEEDRDLLDVAACCGFEFDGVLVGDAQGLSAIPVLKRLANIEKRTRLVRSSGDRFTFDHHQVQEALYQALPASLARAYHAALAEALERRLGVTGNEPPELPAEAVVELCGHYLRGGLEERAIPGLQRAMEHLKVTHRHAESIVLAERALAHPTLLRGAARAEVLTPLAWHLGQLGRRDRQVEAAREALSCARESGEVVPQARAASALGFALLQAGELAEAESVLTAARPLAEQDDDVRVLSQILGSLGQVHLIQGRGDAARDAFERRLAVARDAGAAADEGLALGGLGQVAWQRGRYREALDLHRRHLAGARTSRDRLSEVKALGNIGALLGHLGSHDEARSILEDKIRLAREIGDRLGEARGYGNLGAVSYGRAEFAATREHSTRHLDLCRETGFVRGQALALANLGALARILGDQDEARARAGEAFEMATSRGFREVAARSQRTLGELAADEGRLADAARLLESSSVIWGEIGNPGQEASLLRVLFTVLADGGEHDAARGALTRVRALLAAHARTGTAVLVDAVAAHHLGEDAAAAAERYLAFEESAIHEHRMLARYHLWGATGDVEHLRVAKEILDHFIRHAPPDHRTSVESNVALHRAVMTAWHEHGPRGARDPGIDADSASPRRPGTH